MSLYQKICDIQSTQNIDEMLSGSTMTNGINLVLKFNDDFYFPKGNFVQPLEAHHLTAEDYDLIEVTQDDFADAAVLLSEAGLFKEAMFEKPEWLFGVYLKLMNSDGGNNG